MTRLILSVAIVIMVTAVFAAPYDVSSQQTNNSQSVYRGNPGVPEPPHIMDDTLFSWDFTQTTGWTFTDASDMAPQWHPDTVPGRGTDSAWWCANNQILGYGNYWYQVVQTPMIDLSTTTTPTLACKLWYSFEVPGSTGYDGVTLWISTNGGTTWSVLSGVSPAYSSTSLNAASTQCWNLGTVPGYTGFSGSTYPGGYRVVTANLTNYRQDSVMVRWTVLSDRAISAESRGIYAPMGVDSMFGCYLDSVRIMDGATSLFSDDGGHRGANTLQTVRTHGFGQHWEWNTTNYTSSPQSARCFDGYANEQSCLDSPPITLPQRSMYFRFSMMCNMPDTVLTGSNQLRHFFQVYVQSPDSLWHWITTDYMRAGYGATAWYDYGPSSGYSGDTSLNLSPWAGQTIRLRFKALTDYNATPAGTGLWIDDVRILGDNQPLYDIVPTDFHVPFPTTNGVTWSTPPFLSFTNFGRGTMTNLPWALRMDTAWVTQTPIATFPTGVTLSDSLIIPLTPARTLHPAVRITMPTTPPVTTTYYLDDVNIQSTGLYEVGYDSRHWWLSDSLPPTVPPLTTSYAEKFTLTSDGYSGSYYVDAIKFATRGGGAGSVRVRLMTASGATGNLIGFTILDTTVAVANAADTVAVWHSIDVTNRAETRNLTNSILYVIMQQDGANNFPHLAADSVSYGSGHCFTWAGSSATPANAVHDYAIRMMIEWPSTGVAEQTSSLLPKELALSASPNPFNPTTQINIAVPKTGNIQVAIFDINGRMVEHLYSGNMNAGTYRFAWNASRFASGVYFVRLNSASNVVTKKITLLK